MPPLFAPPQRMAEPIPSLPQFFPPPEISSFWGTSIAITRFGNQEVLPTPAGTKYSTGSSPQTSSLSMTLTHPPFSIAPLAVAPLLTSPLLLLLLLFLAPGSSPVALQLRAPPKVSARAPAHRSYHFRGVKLKSCIKKIHHNLYISKQANVRIKHADTEGASHKKFGTDARVQ